MVPPTSSGICPRARIWPISAAASLRELSGRVRLRRIQNIDADDARRPPAPARPGLAVPMSMPRNTCAESTEMISTGHSCASRMAQSLLPLPVGPVRTRTCASVTGHAGTVDPIPSSSNAPRSVGHDCIGWRAASVPSAATTTSISGSDKRRFACTEVRHASVAEKAVRRHPRYDARRWDCPDRGPLRARSSAIFAPGEQRRHARAGLSASAPSASSSNPARSHSSRPSSSASSSCAASSTTSGSSNTCEGTPFAYWLFNSHTAPARARRACRSAPALSRFARGYRCRGSAPAACPAAARRPLDRVRHWRCPPDPAQGLRWRVLQAGHQLPGVTARLVARRGRLRARRPGSPAAPCPAAVRPLPVGCATAPRSIARNTKS